MNETASSSPTQGLSFRISDKAADRIAFLLSQEKEAGSFLRVSVQGGGCSGFQYNFSFDATVKPEDHTFTKQGAVVVVDETSLDLLNQAEIDYVEDLMGAMLIIKNPNATSGCGCGNSFSIF